MDVNESAPPLIKLMRLASGVAILAVAKKCVREREGEELLEAKLAKISAWLSKFGSVQEFSFTHVPGIEEVRHST